MTATDVRTRAERAEQDHPLVRTRPPAIWTAAIDARRSSSGVDAGGAVAERALIGELVVTLRARGPELEPAARELAADPEAARRVLERTGAALLVRLHNCPDDFAATNALQVVNSASARLRSCVDPLAAERFVHLGLSGIERARRWWRPGRRRTQQPSAPGEAVNNGR